MAVLAQASRTPDRTLTPEQAAGLPPVVHPLVCNQVNRAGFAWGWGL